MTDPLREYLIHSYVYYCLDDNIISDAEFDELCLSIQKEWLEGPCLSSPYRRLIGDHVEGDPTKIKGHHALPEQFPDEIVREAESRLAEWEDLRKSMMGVG